MGKKGQGLPLNTIILAILVVIVLIVVVAFFIGGSTSLTDAIKRLFFGTTAGYDYSLALQTCENRCDVAKDMPVETRGNSAYCKTSLAVDFNPIDGEADYSKEVDKKVTIKYYCPPATTYDGGFSESNIIKSLNVNCDLGSDPSKNNAEVKCSAPTATQPAQTPEKGEVKKGSN